MADVAPPSSFTTGMMAVEQHSFTWTIENFPVIRSFKSMTDAQKIDFSAGSTVGHPSKWSVLLRESTVDGRKWIGIYFSIEEPSGSDPTWKNAFAEMAFVMEGAVPFNRNTGPRELTTLKGYGFPQFLPSESTLQRLVIKHTFKLYVPSKSTEASQAKFANQVKEDSGILLYPSLPRNDIKVMSKDKKESAQRSSMKHVMPPSSFATGVIDVEEQSLTWTIDNFPVISKQKSLIGQQEIYFSAGTSVGHPSRWRVYLQESTIDGQKWIGIYFNIVEPPASDPIWKDVFAEMTFAKEGAFSSSRGGTGQMEVSTFPTTGFGRYIVAGGSTEEKLVIKNTFRLFVPSKPTEACQPKTVQEVKELQIQFAKRATKDWDLMMKNAYPGDDIKIISKDKKEFSLQKAFIAAQSPVLEATIRTAGPNLVIELPDISSSAFQILLIFFYTGKLEPDWSDVEILVELTNAAVKYQFQDLLKVLDASFGKVYKMENVLTLFKLTHKLSLKKAEVELLKFIHEKGFSSPEVSSKMLEEVPIHKEKSRLGSPLLRPFRLVFGRNDKNKLKKK